MCAFLVLRDGAAPLSLADVQAHLTTAGLAQIKHPERVEAIDAMPISPAGKILKRILRQRITA